MPTADRRISLSPRERKILDLASQGFTDSEVARHLGISVATVSTYWGRVRMKLGPHNRAELVARHVLEQAEIALEELRDANRALAERLRALSEGADADHLTRLHRRALSEAADGIVLVNSTGRIEMLNDSAASMFGYEASALEGRSINTLVPPATRDVHDQHRAEYLSRPVKRTMGEHRATQGLHQDGSTFPIVATLAGFDIDGSAYVVCGIRRYGPAL